MKISGNFEIVQIGDDYMALPAGDTMNTFQGTVALNEVAAYILGQLKNEVTIDELTELILDEYNVDENTVMKDLETIIKKFKEIGLLRDE